MKVCYIILTCERYRKTRGKLVEETWIRHIGDADYWFLSAIENREDRTLGWNTQDDYWASRMKYKQFFLNFPNTYDWYVMCDDDTYMFPERVRHLFGDPTHPQYIGMIAEKPGLPLYMAGGPGFILSSSTFDIIKKSCNDTPLYNWYSDVMVGYWLKDSNVKFCNMSGFFNYPHDHPLGGGDPATAYSFHYVDEPHFLKYDQLHSQV